MKPTALHRPVLMSTTHIVNIVNMPRNRHLCERRTAKFQRNFPGRNFFLLSKIWLGNNTSLLPSLPFPVRNILSCNSHTWFLNLAEVVENLLFNLIGVLSHMDLHVVNVHVWVLPDF